MKKLLLGIILGYLLSFVTRSAQAGFAFVNVSTIAHLATGPGDETMDYRFNLHLEVEGLDSTSPPIGQAAWVALRRADTVSEFDAVLAETSAALWWADRLQSEKMHIVANVQRMAGQ